MCYNISSLKGCGKCYFNAYDESLIQKLDILAVTKLCTLLLWHSTLDDDTYGMYAVNKLKFSCSGVVEKDSSINSTTTNSEMCSKILTYWYTTHTKDEGRLPYLVMIDTAESIKHIKSHHRLRSKLLNLQKYTERITVCNGYCTEIVPNKEVSECQFLLCSIGTKVNCSKRSLVNILYLTVSEIESQNDDKLTIDDTKAIVVCSGGIRLTSAYIVVDNAFEHTKSISVRLLKLWLAKNRYNITNINIIDRAIARCQNTSNNSDLCKEILKITE